MGIKLEQIRQKLSAWAREQFACQAEFLETVLVQNDHYYGHRFTGHGMVVTWRVGQRTCEMRVDGRLVGTLELPGDLADSQAA